MATLNVQIKTNKDPSEFSKSGQPQQNLTRIANLVKGLASGSVQGSVEVQYNSEDPVAAAGSVVITYASVANNDTLTIGNQTLTCVTGTPSGYTQFKKQTDATTTGDNLAAAINNNSVLSLDFVASNNAGTVTITCLTKGYTGNHTILSTSNGTGFGITAFASGAGGAHSAKTTIGR
jgi:phage tail sheath gpL-like